MPIPKHLRHLYRGEAYEAFRTALLDRAGNACEQCKAPNRQRVFRANRKEFAGWWWSEITGMAHDPRGNEQPHLPTFAIMEANPDLTWRGTKIVLTAAHLNRTPGDDRLENAKVLCQWCHLNYDLPQHVYNSKETRLNRKDSGRPLLQVAS
jgi:hypothetical protein